MQHKTAHVPALATCVGTVKLDCCSVGTAQNVLRLDGYWEGEFALEFCAVTDPLLSEHPSFVPELTGAMDCSCAPY